MSADLLRVLFEASIASSLAIAAVLALRMFLRRSFGASVAYALWLLVPFSVIGMLIPARKIVVTFASQPVATDRVVAAIPGIPVSIADYSSNLVLLLWVIGLLLFAFWLSHQQRRFMASLGVLNQYGEKIFSAENNTEGPSVIGILNPRIVLPSDFDSRYSAEEQDLILMHERTHLARGDTRINLAAALLRCVFWFNPLMHWAYGRFRFDQEVSADANVLSKFPSARKSYADAMLKTQMAGTGLPVACHWQAHHPLKERIIMLKKPTPRKLFRTLGFVFVSALCLGGAFAAWSTQPATIIVAPGKSAFLYETKMDMDVDGDVKKGIVIREAPGKTTMITQGEGDEKWSFEFSLSPLENNRVLMTSSLKHGGQLVGNPKLMIETDKEAGLGVSTKDGSSVFKATILVREWRDPNATAQTNDGSADIVVDNLKILEKMTAEREWARTQTQPGASWRKDLKISFIVDPRKPFNKDEGC